MQGPRAEANAAPITALAGWDPDFIKSYIEHYHKLNTYNDFLQRIPDGKIVRASQIVPPTWREQQVFYQEWLRPQGNYIFGAQVTLSRSGRSELTRISYDVPEKLGHLEGKAARILSQVAPHFRNALEIGARLGSLSNASLAFAALLERVADAAIAISRGRKILYANSAAVDLFAKRLVVRQSPLTKLQFVSPPAEEALTYALSQLQSNRNPASQNFTIVVNGTLRFVHVLPLRLPQSMVTLGTTTPVALVVIAESRRANALPTGILRGFGLSEREAIVAVLIADGLTVKEAAARLGVSPLTIRNQLATGMTKLGARRRADLATVLAGLVPALKL